MDLAKITLANIQVYPALEAFLVGRYDGPIGKQLSNAARWPAESKNKKTMRLKIKEFTQQKCEQYTELNEDFIDSEAEDDAVPAVPKRNTRSRDPATNSQMQSGRSGAEVLEEQTVAQQNRVQFQHKVPSLKEADTEVQVQAEPLLTSPSAMGAVCIRGGFEL